MRPKKKKTSRPHRPAAVPRTYAAAATSAGREEQPPVTIAVHAAEPTLEDDWVKRTPAAALILPPPPQFADGDTTTCQDNAVPDDPSPCPAIPHLVVEYFPSWIRHFATIAGALGHAPNAQAYMRGVIFSPKSASELAIVERTMIEAAAEDSRISWSYDHREIRQILKRQRRPNKAAAKTQVHRVDHARPSAEAAPREAPVDAPVATAIPDAPITAATVSPDAPIPDATNSLDAHMLVATATPDAPTPAATTIPASPTPDASSITLDAPTPTESKTAHHRERRRRRKRAPRPPRAETAWKQSAPTNCLDDMVQAIIKILTTGMAAYLQEKGAMPVYAKRPWVPSQVIWRTRAGERPAQNIHRGTEFPCARPG